MVIREIEGTVFVIDSKFYQVKPGSKVTLSVDIGEFQAGGTSYSWNGTGVVGTPNFSNKAINRPSQKIAGTTMHCMTKVIDINPSTNQTSVTYTLKGGVADQQFPYGVQVTKEHGVAVYQVTFIFVEA